MEETLPEVTQGLDADDQLPAAPAPAAPDVEPGETPDTPEDTGAKPAEKPEGIQKRFDELTRAKHDALRKAAYWEGVAQGHKPEAGQGAEPQAEAEPNQEAFTSYEEYLRAVARWEVSQSLQTERARLHYEREAQTAVQGFEAQTKAAREQHADFDSVVFNPSLAVSETMRDAILHSEGGANLAYHLGQNPEEAERIANLAPMAQVMAIGRLQAKLEAKSAPAAPVPSNAPAPISPVKASAPSHTGLREDLPIDDWMRRRNAQRRAS